MENRVGPLSDWRFWVCFVETVEKVGSRTMWKFMGLHVSLTIKRHQDRVYVYSFHV
jgi:hypothetical protein